VVALAAWSKILKQVNFLYHFYINTTISAEKSYNNRKVVLLVHLWKMGQRRDGPAVRQVCVEQCHGEKVCVEMVMSNSSVPVPY